MKALGIVAEYNPFHNGHQYLIQMSKEKVKPDAVIAVMSGPFVQRGTPAVLDKWTRCQIALSNGADLVCELPVVWATANAEVFASGAVSILNALQCSYISFGSEIGKTEPLANIAHLLSSEPPLFKSILQTELSHGYGFAKAREKCVARLLSPADAEILSQPNNILGIEYLKAIDRSQFNISPITIKRLGAAHDQKTQHSFSSSALRNLIKTNNIDLAKNYLPYSTQILKHTNIVHLERNYENFIRAKLLTSSVKQLKTLPDVSEGLEFSIYNTKKQIPFPSYQNIINSVSSKRIPKSRIRRILFYLALNISNSIIKECWENEVPYIKILGMNTRGRTYLSSIKKSLQIPLLVNPKSNQVKLNMQARDILNFDVRAQNLWNFLNEDSSLFQDYRHLPILNFK
ncbi:nucleotidyltransferase [Pseudoramibacter sp.]|uniref:nucleotidyltransferase n=1 Tax=Pseudoramibacter sp. TaxID=2034862 RepID=UPI0025CD6BE8|nr:nucleotidyltransferase [Pseudoramibacter sp.]MCH4072783.1 nucleotidyltransferase [Pseudoramibacter sp.]MCH4106554.1 nucleotidyltransferase [Pseudoramibacter sp.]